MWHPGEKRHAGLLVGDCEAFLTGRIAERIERRSGCVPAWAWMNLLAHGTEEELRAECGTSRPPWTPVWRQARSYLAGEVLDFADACGSLSEIQLRVLAPVELALTSPPVGYDPRKWVLTVMTALDRDRHARCRRRVSPSD